jgi:hypothetical protein
MKKLILLVVGFLFVSSLNAQTDISGDWSGAISIMGVELGIVAHFKT